MTEISGPDPLSTIELFNAMSEARTMGILTNALAMQFPTEAEWTAFTNDPDVVECIENFTEVIRDMRATLPQVGNLFTTEQLQEAVTEHYSRALDEIESLAEKIGVEPEVLLHFLLII